MGKPRLQNFYDLVKGQPRHRAKPGIVSSHSKFSMNEFPGFLATQCPLDLRGPGRQGECRAEALGVGQRKQECQAGEDRV